MVLNALSVKLSVNETGISTLKDLFFTLRFYIHAKRNIFLQVIAGKDVDDEAIIDMSHVIVCGSDGGITSAAHDGETVIDTGVDTEETVLRLSGENEIHVHTISTSDVSTQHDQVEFITVSSSEDASHIPETGM